MHFLSIRECCLTNDTEKILNILIDASVLLATSEKYQNDVLVFKTRNAESKYEGHATLYHTLEKHHVN